MTKKNILFLIASILLLIFGVVGYLKISKETKINIEKASTSYHINSSDLIASFSVDKKISPQQDKN
jgi:predicted negative regulator of RcsB-dependent stress response